MPRHPRLFVQSIPLHVVQRGDHRQPVFRCPDDYAVYLSNLRETRVQLAIRVLAFCLMTKYVQLIVVPDEEAANVSRLMHVLAVRQTRRVESRGPGRPPKSSGN